MNDHKHYYIVKNLTALNGGTSFRQGTLDGDNYDLVKTATHIEPTGEMVVEYFEKAEVLSAMDLPLFNGSPNMGPAILERELLFCEQLANQFRAAQASLTIAAGEVLFTELEAASHAISRGLVNLAWNRFNQTDSAVVTPALKAQFNALFNAYFDKYPRDLS